MRKTFDFTGHVRHEPVEFVLNGVLIHCAKNISGLSMLKFAAIASDDEDGVKMAAATLDLLREIILPSSWDAFEAIASDPDAGIGAEELGEIVGYLAEVYAERPTQPSSSSSSGDEATGPGSTAISSPAALTAIP